jgi:hypothetical protein
MQLSRAHKSARMTRKTPSDFGSHDGWLALVRSELPVVMQAYMLAFSRMELVRSFYQMRRLSFAAQLARKLEDIEARLGPDRTIALEVLNDAVLGDLTKHLFNRTTLRTSENGPTTQPSARIEIEALFNHFAQKNPNFALSTPSKRPVSDNLGCRRVGRIYPSGTSGHMPLRKSPVRTRWSTFAARRE